MYKQLLHPSMFDHSGLGRLWGSKGQSVFGWRLGNQLDPGCEPKQSPEIACVTEISVTGASRAIGVSTSPVDA